MTSFIKLLLNNDIRKINKKNKKVIVFKNIEKWLVICYTIFLLKCYIIKKNIINYSFLSIIIIIIYHSSCYQFNSINNCVRILIAELIFESIISFYLFLNIKFWSYIIKH